MIRSFGLLCVLLYSGVASSQSGKPARPAITGISHVTFFADDLAKSEQFYGSTLGWEQVPAGVPNSGVHFYANHVQYIELLSPPSKGRENRLDGVAFSTSDADALRRYLGANGVKVPPAAAVESNGDRSFTVRDPEGNKVEFTQAGPNAPKGGTSVSSRVSGHINHAGYVVRSRAAEDAFYKNLLGFHVYWEGGAKPGQTDWVMMQVPDGTDWLEYMLRLPVHPSRAQLASANHFSPGVLTMADLEKKLKQNGWVASAQQHPPLLGVDGKWQYDLADPDGTRVEFMEFLPYKNPCCAPYKGRQPSLSTAW
jgi:catechol 2,3-dioxygenase-like lactoylglutathione lyase family enzyme